MLTWIAIIHLACLAVVLELAYRTPEQDAQSEPPLGRMRPLAGKRIAAARRATGTAGILPIGANIRISRAGICVCEGAREDGA